VLVDVVGTPANSDAFPGLYPDFFAGNCLLSLSESSKECAKSFMVLQSCWASRTVILTVNLEDGTVNKHDSDPITSWKPLATDGAKRLLAIRSSTISPPELMLGTFSEVNELSIDWVTVKSWNYSFKENLHCKFCGQDAEFTSKAYLCALKLLESARYTLQSFLYQAGTLLKR
jgi:acylaminoacyl-peptidase